ncbi:MAG: hypothetical protein HAW67_06080 [Endozoicomonadaceae bacterium]|nr:hypothetical protein [Endozoicomonadaceae bacterium]
MWGFFHTPLIDGVEYVPKGEIPALTDERLQNCLETLTEMRYHNEHHKMRALAYRAIEALDPELANLSIEAAYDRIHGGDE